MSTQAATLTSRLLPVSLFSVTHSEWVKFRSLISYPLTALAILVLLVALGLLGALSQVWSETALIPPNAQLAPGQLLQGVQYALILLAILAVVFFASEYTQGTIQPSLLSAPRRTNLLAAKIIVTGATGLVLGVVGSGLILAVTPLVLAGSPLELDDSPATLIRTVVGTGLYLGLTAVLATGLAALIRALVPAFLTAVVLLTVAPLLLSAVPVEWAARLTLYLPTVAGAQYLTADPTAALLNPWLGLGILAAWALTFAVAGGIALRLRDA